MSSTTVSLADGFDAATHADWSALVEKTLKGAQVETLTSPGPDGLAIAPLYEASLEPTPFAPAPRGGERPWDIRTKVRHPSRTAARTAVLEDSPTGVAAAVAAGCFVIGVPSVEGVVLDDATVTVSSLALAPL